LKHIQIKNTYNLFLLN